MASLESTGVLRPGRPDEASSSRSPHSTTVVRPEVPRTRPPRSSPDPLAATDRYRLNQPLLRSI